MKSCAVNRDMALVGASASYQYSNDLFKMVVILAVLCFLDALYYPSVFSVSLMVCSYFGLRYARARRNSELDYAVFVLSWQDSDEEESVIRDKDICFVKGGTEINFEIIHDSSIAEGLCKVDLLYRICYMR